MNNKPIYKRALLELSGEMMGSSEKAIDMEVLNSLVSQLREIRDSGVQIAIVIGAGNIWRGAGNQDIMSRPKADMIGMLGTVVNSLALHGALENSGIPACILSAIQFEPVVEVDYVEPYVTKYAIEYLEEGRIVVFAGGTGNPFFTTDTAAALRALQIDADVLLKATKVDGVYSEDPVKKRDAKRYKSLKLEEALRMKLRIMDAAAFSLCRDNNLPIVVYSLNPKGNTRKVIFGEEIGTTLTP